MAIRSTPVGVPAYNTRLLGDLTVPDEPLALVILAHMSATNPWNPRERHLVPGLQARGFAALRLDLLTTEESVMHIPGRRAPQDMAVLARRLTSALDWAVGQAQFANLPVACLATGHGAPVALTAAADRPQSFHALASLDGLVDQASGVASSVRAPTLLVAARENREVVAVNEHVLTRLRSLKQLALVEETSSLLDDQRSIDEATRLSTDWFTRFLGLPESGQKPSV